MTRHSVQAFFKLSLMAKYKSFIADISVITRVTNTIFNKANWILLLFSFIHQSSKKRK